MKEWTCALCNETHPSHHACIFHPESNQVFCAPCEVEARFVTWYSAQGISELIAQAGGVITPLLVRVRPVQILDERLRALWAAAVKAHEFHRKSPPGGPTYDVLIEALKVIQRHLNELKFPMSHRREG